MKDYIVVISSNRAYKDGSFNTFGSQHSVRKEFNSLKQAKEFVENVSDDIYRGKLPTDLKTTDKTAFIEIVAHQPYDGLSSIFRKERVRYVKPKKIKRL